MIKDVYNELALDLVKNCGLTMFDARKVARFLSNEGHVDYDALKEYYLDEEDEVFTKVSDIIHSVIITN